MAMGTYPYDAAGHGRRALGWNSTRLGHNTLLFSYGLDLQARSRDAIRNNGWAQSAVESYKANAIGRGIRPIFQHPQESVREFLARKWRRWVRESDVEYDPRNPASGQTDFYGQQMLTVGEVMGAGEMFVRFITRPLSEGMTVPLQLQLIQSEQLPLWRMTTSPIPDGNVVRMGIEFRPDLRREAYHFWKAHPGETMFYPLEGLSVERVPARDVLHVYKPITAGQMRGEPWLTSVLAKLYELDKLFDAEVVKKQVASMITGFIHQVDPGNPVMPAASGPMGAQAQQQGVQLTNLQPGTFPVLNSGESVEFAKAPESGDFATTIVSCLRAFAAGAGIAYEQLGDLSQLNYSSIRAGLLEFRRKAQQFQHAVFIFQVCHPIGMRWLREGMMALSFGEDLFHQYSKDPEPFEDIKWQTDGWDWVDPEKDVKASEQAVRDGFSSRSIECASRGYDVSDIDAQNASDNKSADKNGLIYDSNPNKVVTGRNAGLTEQEIAQDAKQGKAAIQP